jgi:cytochrome c oxidase subunit 2
MSANKTASLFGSVALAALAARPALGAYEVNFQHPATPIAGEIYDLHMLVLWICVAIGVVVFAAMFYAILRYRKSVGAKAATFHENTAVEVVWTIVPFLILVALAIPATRTLIAMDDTSDADVTVKVTGYQWKWKYDYLEDDISFFSTLSTPWAAIENESPKPEEYLLEVDNEVVLPVNKKIRFLFTANDVLHAWWVPALGVKKDAIPGFINESWARIEKPGVYRGQCAELCGAGHGFMPIVVRAVSDEDYASWVQTRKGANQAAAEQTSVATTAEQSKLHSAQTTAVPGQGA